MTLPLIISIPHCSRRIPEDLRAAIALTDHEIWDSADIGTAEIFGTLPARVVLRARWSRLIVDLNRNPDRRYEKGVVARTDYHGRSIHRPGSFPDESEVQRRIRKYYRPFHRDLAATLDNPAIRAVFDCHSLNGIGPADAPDAGKKRKDIILSNNGDREGNRDPARGEPSCPRDSLQRIKGAFQDAGFSVSVNDPYGGGFITVHYGRLYAERGKFCVQIEINQDLYRVRGGLRLDPVKTEAVTKRVHAAFQEIARDL